MPVLTPVFRATWTMEGGGMVQVTRMEVAGEFNWAADYLMKRTEEIYAGLPQSPQSPVTEISADQGSLLTRTHT